MRDAPATQLENYVRYIATREGAEKIDESKRNLPATKNQQKLIRQLIRDIPSSKEVLEYTDFLLQPTSGNVSEFISCVLEQNLDLAAKRENYVDYIANRPRVDRIGEHGLFTDAGKPVVISRVQKEVVDHKGPVWTHVVSLRREDAARLGYDNAEQWMALLRSKRAMLCRYMKIGSENLRWYAAFHNESHHPHVHLMVYSAKDNDGFLTEKSIEAMRSELAHDIFRQDFAHIYEQQNQARADVKTGAADVLRELMEALRSGTLVSPEIETQMVQLSKRLQNTKGKKVYGYLKRDVKDLIDQIVGELAKDSRVAALYQEWGRWNNEIVLTYQKEAPPLLPLSKQPQFKSIKNMVIAEAMKLGGHHFTFEDEEMMEPAEPSGEILPEGTDLEETIPEQHEQENEYTAYALVKLYLDGDELPKDVEKAIQLLKKSVDGGNSFAAYRLGKLYLTGEDVPKNVDTAIYWLSQSAEQGNPFAQYALGKLYLCGHDVPRDKEKAIPLLTASAEQGNIYAQFLLDHLDSFQDPSVFLAATRLMRWLENLFREDYQKAAGASSFHIDRKRRRRLAEKKQAQGHKRDDQEQAGQHTYG